MKSITLPSRLAASFFILASSWFIFPSVFAGDWFTSRTVDNQSQPISTLAAPPDGSQSDASVSPAFLTVRATDLPLNIPDNNPIGVTSNLPINRNGASGPFTVSYYITHPFIGDLVVTLVSPSGSRFILHNQTGGSSDNLAVYGLEVPAAQSEFANGVWKLNVQDRTSSDVGSLDYFALSFPDAGVAAIDLVVSLISNPPGDDNGNQQGQPGSQGQDIWERIFQHFADGVYESTNGAHKIRTVRLFRSGRWAGSADIAWGEEGHPHVPRHGGIGERGGRIHMYERFLDGEGPGISHNMLVDEIGSGYTLAHEWSHYFYGLSDEYKIESSDTVVAPSLMNSQWIARGGNPQWLNFSIKNTGGGEFQNTLQTLQHAQHGASDWETLARMPANDPKTAAELNLGKRVFYPELAAAAPAAGMTPRIDLPGTARSELDIVWMNRENVFQIIIDRSAGMANDGKLEQAKAAAKFMLLLVPLGEGAVGVSQFNTTVTQIQPVVPILTEADREMVRAKIDAITPAGGVGLGNAVEAGLATILATPVRKL